MNTERDVEAYAVIEEFAAKFEQEFSLVSIDSSIGSSTFEYGWVVDSGATRHMTRLYESFQMITMLGPGHFIQTDIDSPRIAIQGVGIVRFQLDLGEILKLHGVLFVPKVRVGKLSVSSFEDEGYGMMVRSGHIFVYWRDEPVATTILLGDRRDRLYVLRGHVVRPRAGTGAGGCLSESEDDDTAFDRDEESDSLLSTGRRLSQSSDGEVEQDDGTQVESRMSEFQFKIGHLLPKMIPEQEGVVARGQDEDNVADLPH